MKIVTKQGSATSAKPYREADVPTGGVMAVAPSPLRGVIIAHLCNHKNRWGRGFVLAVNDLSLAARNAYRAFCEDYSNQVPLGTTQFVEVQPDVWVANMIAQNGTDKSKVPGGCLVDYASLDKCLKTVFERAVLLGCNVHIPSGMGSGLAGGDESTIHGKIKACATSVMVELLELQMKFVPTVTLWEFQDTTAKSYVGPAAPKQAMVDAVVGTPDNSDANDDVLDLDEVLKGL